LLFPATHKVDLESSRTLPVERNQSIALSTPWCNGCVITSDESGLIFLLGWSSICQYGPKIPTVIVTKKPRVSLLLTHPVLCILKMQKAYSPFW